MLSAISSFRPLGEDLEYDRNQLAAKASWDNIFDEIIYFNRPEPRLETKRTFFIGDDTHPAIREVCHVAGMQTDWACIVNADILVCDNLLRVLPVARARKAWALVSYRWQPAGNGTYKVTDNGLDFFAALPPIWKQAEKACPERLWLGHQQWDTWMIGFLNSVAPQHFFDITRWQAVYHPQHGGRRYKFNVDGVLQGMRLNCAMPPRL